VVQGQSAFESTGPDGSALRPDIDPALTEEIQGVDGVAKAEPTVFTIGTLLDEQNEPLTMGGAPTFAANWTGVPEIDGFDIVDGAAPEGPDEAVVDRTTADQAGLSVGDPVRVQTINGTFDFTMSGTARFGSSGNLAGASFILADTATSLERFAVGGRVQSIYVVADDGVSQREVVDRVGQVLPDNVEVITAEESTEDQQESITSIIDQLRIALTVFALVSLVAGAFLIYNTFGIIIGQRVRELALLRAMGSSRSQVLWSVIAESAAIGLVASLLGLLGGIALALLLQAGASAIGLDLPTTNTVIAPRTVLVSILVGTVITVVSSVVPALRASRVAPVAALREAATDDASRSIPRLVIGVVISLLGIAAMANGSADRSLSSAAFGTAILFAGVITLGPFIVPVIAQVLGAPLKLLGISGTLGRDNARRNPKRSAGTAAALTLAVTIITFFAIFVLSFNSSLNAATDRYLKADLEVGGANGFSLIGPSLVDELAARDEVAAVTGVQRGQIQIDGTSRIIYGVNPPGVEANFDLQGVEGDLAAMAPDEIAIDRGTARIAAWGIGTQLDVTYPDGMTGVLTVAAIYSDGNIVASGDPDSHYLVSDEVFAEHFPANSQFLTRAVVTGAEGVALADLRRVVEDEAEAFPSSQVRDKEQIKDDANGQLIVVLGLFTVLLGLALVIGALGVTITLALSVFERTREIGLLRAVGATRRQMAGAICAESVVLTLLGTVLGLAVGIAGGVAVVSTQRETIDPLEITVPPFFVVAVLVIAVMIGVTASLVPAWRAARLNVLDAITVE
jgi:putative ABC transport system permease protein